MMELGAAMMFGGNKQGGSMARGRYGSSSRDSSSSHDSNSHKQSWLVDAGVEDQIIGLLNGGMDVNYIDQMVAGMTPAEQAALQYFGSGQGITTGTNAAKWGVNAIGAGINGYKTLLSGGTSINKNQFQQNVLGLYADAGDYMNTQNAAIEQQASVNIANTLAGNAESFNNTNSGVSGSSMQNNANMAVMQQGMNSAAQREADVSNMVMKSAIGLTASGMSAKANLMTSGMSGAIGLGTHAITGGVNMASKAAANQFKSGLFQQYYNQQVMNNDRRNQMINSNLSLAEQLAALSFAGKFANIDTTTESHSSGSSSSSASHAGLFG
ncbi:hypothetical protein ABK933_03560 [Klebsiella aerogenes]|uniref:hypothetical protein n=1 Tax=Klebsiella aerogenes TaxID=548 RepID=UPI002B27A00F|nr:hypothetical protein [Klebsiella aerogenes]MEA8782140.1 hypothetical protein [Klebsiella aerogenes]